MCTFLIRVSFQACSVLHITYLDVILKFLDASFMHFYVGVFRSVERWFFRRTVMQQLVGCTFCSAAYEQSCVQGSDASCHVTCVCALAAQK